MAPINIFLTILAVFSLITAWVGTGIWVSASSEIINKKLEKVGKIMWTCSVIVLFILWITLPYFCY